MPPNPLDIGLVLPTAGGISGAVEADAISEAAVWAESNGFDSAWAGDHVVHHGPILDCIVALSTAAASTSRIRVGTGVLLLALRGLTVAAKQLASLAYVSQGRLIVGVGVGGEFPLEWEASGVPLAERGSRTDEYLPVLRRLLDGERVAHQGTFAQLDGVRLEPVPPAPVPILGSGRALRALNRAARVTNGWIGFLQTPNGFSRAVALLKDERVATGRASEPFTYGLLVSFHLTKKDEGAHREAAELLVASHGGATVNVLERFVVAGTAASVVEQLVRFRALGCSLFVVNPADDRPVRRAEQFEEFAREVIPVLRALAG